MSFDVCLHCLNFKIMKQHAFYPETIQWLLGGDPAVAWQCLRDLCNASPEVYGAERRRMEKEGWAARLLNLQDADGLWGKGVYTPKWTSTHYTLMLLRRLGLPPDNEKARKACRLLLKEGYFRDGGISFFSSMPCSETCVTGMVLSVLAYFGIEDERLHIIAEYLLGQQLPDGGWNCWHYKGATHSSFHTTISVLEGLHEYETRFPRYTMEVLPAQAWAREFLLEHRLFRSHRTGQVVDPKMTRLSFPPRWRYDILRVLDHFQDCRAPADERCADAITILRNKEKNGRWPLQQRHSGRIFFEMEKPGQPSRINTLRALRVLQWWYQGHPEEEQARLPALVPLQETSSEFRPV